MSLINKMLRDLDARRIGEGERAALPTAVTPLSAYRESRRALPFLLVGGLLIVTMLGGVALYGVRTGNLTMPGGRAVTAVPETPAVPKVLTAPPAPMVPAVIDAPATSDPVVASPPASAAPVAVPSLRLDNALLAAPPAPVEPVRKGAATALKPLEHPGTSTHAASSKPLAPPGTSTDVISSKNVATATSNVPAPRFETSIDKQVRLPSASERAESEYRRGLLAQRQGNLDEAAGLYRAALANYPEHVAARQTLAALLIDARNFDEAEDVLRKGTELPAVRLTSILGLARLKVERNQTGAALDLLLKNVGVGERSAEYQGFLGALLNRVGRTAEAIEHYRAATRLAPSEGRWWAGLGIALDATGKSLEAREAYQKARALPGLPADLAQHVEHRLR